MSWLGREFGPKKKWLKRKQNSRNPKRLRSMDLTLQQRCPIQGVDLISQHWSLNPRQPRNQNLTLCQTQTLPPQSDEPFFNTALLHLFPFRYLYQKRLLGMGKSSFFNGAPART